MSTQNQNFPGYPNVNVINAGKTGIFTNYIYKAIPLAFDESMSYYECLCGLLDYLKNTIIPTLNNNADAIIELQTLYEELHDYVKHYFDSLDVQEEINNKLDEMAENGELTDIIAQYLGLAGMITFNSVADMKSAENLVNNSKCATLGYHSANDGGNALYTIRNVTNNDVIDEASIIALHDNTLVAELIIDSEIHSKQCGCYGDYTHDDTTCLQKAIQIAENTVGVLFIDQGRYKITDKLLLNKAIKIKGAYERGLTGSGNIYGTQIDQTTANTDIFYLNDSNDYYGMEVSKLRLSGSGGVGLNFNHTGHFSEFIIEKVHINGGFNKGMSVSGSIGRINDCDFSVCDIGLELTTIRVTVNDNNFWNNNVCDIKFSGTTRDCDISNNWFEKTVTTGSHLLMQAPSYLWNILFNENSFQSTSVPSIIFDGATNITDIMRFIDVKFTNCRFCPISSYGVYVKMRDENNNLNSNASNTSMIRFENCEFDRVNGHAVETDYNTLYWCFVNSPAYSNYGYGSATITASEYTGPIAITEDGRWFKTNSYIAFTGGASSNYTSTKNTIYLSSTNNRLVVRDNDNIAHNFQYVYAVASTNRPTGYNGLMIFDTTLNKPIWYYGTKWYDSTGTEV